MRNQRVIWLASYPRSGNTLLRTILWQCFNLRSASIYPNDLGGNKSLETYVGHIEHSVDGQIQFPNNSTLLIKTHAPPTDKGGAIYIVRDGKAACVSLWEFYKRSLPLEAIIEGQHHFGTWSGHLSGWEPWNRPNTLLLRYEDMASDLPPVLTKLSKFLNVKTITDQIPSQDSIADADGRWVRKKSGWQSIITDDQLKLFNIINGNMMSRMGYRD